MNPEVSIEMQKNFYKPGVGQQLKQGLGRIGLAATMMLGAGSATGVGYDVYSSAENIAEAAPDSSDPAGYPYPAGVTSRCGSDGATWCYQGRQKRNENYYSNCTDYVDWILETYMGVNLVGGHGANWVNAARAAGYRVDNTPEPGDVYSTPATSTNPYGHVGLVESVNSNGSVNTINYNGFTGRFFRTTGYYAPYADINGTGNHLNFNQTSSPSPSATLGSEYFLNWDNDGGAEKQFGFGRAGDKHFVGDWDGDGKDEIGLRRGTTYYYDFDNNGSADKTVSWGREGDMHFVGDFNGDGRDDLGLRRGTQYFLDYNQDGHADKTVSWGRSTDILMVGDWDGDGSDDLGLRRGTRYFQDYNEDGNQDASSSWGRSSDKHIVGDWNGDGRDDLGLWRSSNATFYFDYNTDGRADRSAGFGRSTDKAITGDFNQDGRDDVGVRRGSTYYFNWDFDGGSEKVVNFGRSTDQHFIGNWFGNGDNIGLRR